MTLYEFGALNEFEMFIYFFSSFGNHVVFILLLDI
jgi:hypothetical protein